jgi:methanogenic corrinoid protein MtbC1
MTESLIDALVEMQEAEALKEANRLLGEGVDPMSILGSCSKAMEIVGKRFESEEYFLPHLMMAGEMLKQISEMVKPFIKEEKAHAGRGRVLIGTVEGDIHDIGKNMVVFILEASGFRVLDIGVDQVPGKFVQSIQSFQPQVVGMSGLLTLSFDSMKETVRAIEEAGLREEVRIMIGGGQVTEKVRDYTGADSYASDAVAGIRLCRQWIGGK